MPIIGCNDLAKAGANWTTSTRRLVRTTGTLATYVAQAGDVVDLAAVYLDNNGGSTARLGLARVSDGVVLHTVDIVPTESVLAWASQSTSFDLGALAGTEVQLFYSFFATGDDTLDPFAKGPRIINDSEHTGQRSEPAVFGTVDNTGWVDDSVLGKLAYFNVSNTLSPTLATVSGDNTYQDGDTAIPITGANLDAATSLAVRTDGGGTYQDSVTAGVVVSDPSNATFNDSRINTPLSTASWQLQLGISDGTTTDFLNITRNPSAGWAVVEAAGTLVIAGDNSVVTPYTGPDPVVQDQVLYQTTSAQGGTVVVSPDLTFEVTYGGTPPQSDSFDIEMWSDGGSGRVWTTATVSVEAPAQVPQGVITVGSISVGQISASAQVSYDLDDITNYQYSLDGGAWTVFEPPLTFPSLERGTLYNVDVRVVNADGAGPSDSFSFTTLTANTVDVRVPTADGIPFSAERFHGRNSSGVMNLNSPKVKRRRQK